MNSVENLKSTQCRKLFKIFKSSYIQSFNIFGAREGFLSEFKSLSEVWKFEKLFNGPGPHVSGMFLFDRRSTLPTWVGPSLPLLRTSPRKPSHTLLFPLPCSATLLAPLLCAGYCFAHRCLSPMSCPKLSERAKRNASSPCPSCTKSLPAAPASEAGPWDFPAVVFLCEHLASGSPRRLFPHPADSAAISAPLRSSSPTTSSATSTTPLAAIVPPPGEHPCPDLLS
jgi:hypothetical protein